MPLVLNDEQTMLQDIARDFLADKAPVSQLRALRDRQDPAGFDESTWSAMAGMGWAGVLIPEEFGGLGLSFVAAGVLMQEMGRTLTPSPYFATSVLGATLIAHAGTDTQKGALLPAMATGALKTALAIDEGGRHRPQRIGLEAKPMGNGFELSGTKTFVLDGHIADKLIVAARTNGALEDAAGITLFLVDKDTAGVSCERTIMVDSRNAARFAFKGAQVSGEDVLGAVDSGFAALEHTLDVGRIFLAAEMAGLSEESLQRTLGYLKERDQFGRKIGSFQALQHRAAHLYSEIELVKSAVLKGLQTLDAAAPDTPLIASMVKAKASSVAVLATNEAVQMHGGIGMTDEFDIGFFMKRARAAQETFGDAAFHSGRLAQLAGY
jgi:acyl-CoA dehydrogenase